MDQKNQPQKKVKVEKKEEVKAEGNKDYRPFIQQDGQDNKRIFDDSSNSADFMTIDQRETMRELDDSQVVGPPPSVTTHTALVVKPDVHMVDVPVTVSARVPDVTSGKRKRGRPPRAQGKVGAPPPPPPPQRKQVVVDDEEDVCFICFDGGSLVLCDRRGCPKAYHPACIKRDEAFFRSKAKWNCGWHICISCQKASHYMCYTCTYSLCKGCTKDADYVCVRSNKGFCGTCMKTIMLIENVSLANVEKVQVDFDDKMSWEYLFKVYWVCLKDKLSLTVDELMDAKNPWNGDELLPKARNSWKRNGIAAHKDIVIAQPAHANNEKVPCLGNCNGNGEGTLSKRRKTNDQSDQLDQEKLNNEKNTIVTEKATVQKVKPLSEGRTWATKALLEFVSHMKDGDSSMLSQVDVQALVLEYVNKNNLRDPCENCQIVCDARLLSLFRKPRVGHLEMLKLLEYHFLTSEKPQPDAAVRTTVDNAPSSQLEGASNCDTTVDNAPSSQLKGAINCDASLRTTVDNARSSQLKGASNCDPTVTTKVSNVLSSQLEGATNCDATVRTTVDNALSSQAEGASNSDASVKIPVDNALSSQLEAASNSDASVKAPVDNALSSQLEGASNSDATLKTPVDNALSSKLEGASNSDATVKTPVDNALSSKLEGASNSDATVKTPVNNALSGQLEGASNSDATGKTPVDNAISSQSGGASNTDATVTTTIASAPSSQLKGAIGSDSQQVIVSDRMRKTRKRKNEKGSAVNPNPDEYAAIDVHNINLLYLNRNLMENLMDDAEKFHEKVVGSFVRIRIPVDDQKQNVHRLVQVAGTCKEDESYKVGSRTINIKLEILNLDKKEVISIDGISDQDFSEDECRRLRHSINSGLMKRLKVGEIEEKAMVLLPVKVNACLEAEISRLNHLRDQAKEKKRRKEVKECVGKIELLKSPKERERRLLQIPSVHIDPRMAPSPLTKDDPRETNASKQSDHVKLNSTGVPNKGIELNSSPGEGDQNDVGHRALKTLAAASEQFRKVEMKSGVYPGASVQIHEGGNDSNSQNASKNELGGADSAMSESVPGSELSVNDEKLWNYQDPSGKIQGPFSMTQLRKWSEIKIFPDDFRVWKINEKQHDSILLTDALIGQFPKEPLQPENSALLPQEEAVACKDEDKKQELELRQGTADVTLVDNKRADLDQKLVQKDVQIHCNSNDELAKNNGLAIHGNSNDELGKSNGLPRSISWIKDADEAQARSSVQVWEFPEANKSGTGQSGICSSLPEPLSSGKSYEAPLVSERERHKNEKWSLKSSNADKASHLSTSEEEKRVESEGHSGENWRPQSMNSVTSEWDPNSSFLSMLTSTEQNEKISFSNMQSQASMQPHVDLKNQVTAVNSSGPPSWSTASTLVIGGRQVPEVAIEWLGYSSNLVSSSSLKPNERTNDHAPIPTSGTDQLTLSSSNHPTIDASSWQPIVPEPNEFCSLVDESVSDLLAEVEAMESLGLPSPTSKLRYDLELTPGSDDDCFSPVERFSSPAPDPGKSDALSSTGDIQIPSQLSAVEESLRLSLMPSQLTIMDNPHPLAQIQRQGIVLNGPLRSSQIPSQSQVTEEPLRLWQRDVLDPRKREEDAKRSEISVNQWDIGLEMRPMESKVPPPKTSTGARQWEDGPAKQNPPSTVDVSRRSDKGNSNLNRGVAQGNPNVNMVWGHGSIQQQGSSTNSGISTGSPGILGSQPRYGGDSRHSGPREYSGQRDYSGQREHRNRDSGSGRDRSSWNSSSRQGTYGAGNGGGGSFKAPSRGRVCKYYESGHCKKGASCSFWHPS